MVEVIRYRMLILIGDCILLTNSEFQSRNAKITRFWTRVMEITCAIFARTFPPSPRIPDTRLARILKARLQTCLIKGSLKAQNQRKDGGKYGGKLVYEFIASVYGQ